MRVLAKGFFDSKTIRVQIDTFLFDLLEAMFRGVISYDSTLASAPGYICLYDRSTTFGVSDAQMKPVLDGTNFDVFAVGAPEKNIPVSIASVSKRGAISISNIFNAVAVKVGMYL